MPRELTEDERQRMSRPHWNHYFMVQVVKPTIWVRWTYCREDETPNLNGYLNHMRKTIMLGQGEHAFAYHPKLPEGYGKGNDKMVGKAVDEVTSWGWRIYSKDSPQCNGDYTLAPSLEACLELAMKSFKNQGLIPDGLMLMNEDGTTEEPPMPPEWQSLAEEAKAAVESWASGKGWPDGWRGKD